MRSLGTVTVTDALVIAAVVVCVLVARAGDGRVFSGRQDPQLAPQVPVKTGPGDDDGASHACGGRIAVAVLHSLEPVGADRAAAAAAAAAADGSGNEEAVRVTFESVARAAGKDIDAVLLVCPDGAHVSSSLSRWEHHVCSMS